MKRDELTKLFLAEGQTEPTAEQKAVIDKVMALNGQDVEAAKGDTAKLKADLQAAQADAEAKQAQLEAANAQIKAFESKDLDIEAVRKSAADYEAQAKKAKEDAAAQVAQLRFDHALDGALAGAKARNTTAVRALLKVGDLKLTDEGKVSGLDEQLKAIRENNAFLFEAEEAETPPPNATAGVTPPAIGPQSFVARALKAAGLPAE